VDGIPITGMAGDQQRRCSAGVLRSGMVKSTYGTGWFGLANHGPEFRISKTSLTTVASRLNGKIFPHRHARADFTAGAAVQWLRTGLASFMSSDTEALAEIVE